MTNNFIEVINLPNALLMLQHEQQKAMVKAWKGDKFETRPEMGNCWGFLQEGSLTLTTKQGSFTLTEGMYFAAPDPVCVEGAGKGVFVTITGERTFFTIGGAIEDKGRLRYIDGCTDSLLISPTMLGEPCLNLLHIPPYTFQSPHTHPSFRAGVIVRGNGRCVTGDKEIALQSGQVFVIPAEAVHNFATDADDLLVIAFHPDSDFGPTHEDHPMLNRTFLTV